MPNAVTTLEQLKGLTLAQLEALYVEPHPVAVPTGCFRGTHLCRLDRPGARRPGSWGSRPFAVLPFGIDFDRRCWFFFDPRLRAGRFSAHVARSRWRATTTVALHYGVSRLPGPIRRALYDEVKPLSERLCLGFGGLRGERGVGDHFFFALHRVE